MKSSQSERETLIGPAVVGVVVGILFAICNVAFNSDYKAAPSSGWSTISDTMLSFLVGFLSAFVPFGLAPVLIGRAKSGAGKKSG
jgi:hypothetical protein